MYGMRGGGGAPRSVDVGVFLKGKAAETSRQSGREMCATRWYGVGSVGEQQTIPLLCPTVRSGREERQT